MDPFRRYIITQIIKQTGKIPRADTVLSNAVAQLKIRLKNAGEDIAKITDPKQITQFFNKETSYWKQQVQQAIKAKDIGTKFSKQKGPFEGFTPKIVPKPKDIKSKLDKQNKESIQRWKDKMKKDPPEDLAGGGIAGMLGEPTYQDDNHRVPLKWGKRPISAGIQVLDPDFDEDIDIETLIKELIQSTQERSGRYQTGGRVPLSWGGFLMKLLQKSPSKLESLKDFTSKREFILSLIGQSSKQRNKRMLAQIKEEMEKIRKNPPFKFPDTDKIKKEVWKELTKGITKHADGGRVPLKKGKTPFKPPLPDENWMESWWKNLGPWEKISVFGWGLPFEKGGRVGLWQGGLAAALRFLMQKYGKDVIKLAKDVKPSKKWDTQKAIQGFLERNPQFKNKITSHAGDAPRAGEGKFTKAEVLLEMFKNTIKQSKSANTKKRFTNFIKEIQNKPELAKESKVWNFFTKGLPKDQRLTVYADDTVDFWRQSKFGPHNIKTTDKFMKKHPYLTRDQAIKIQNMEPENQIFELKKIQALNKRTTNAEGGRVPMLWGGGIKKKLQTHFDNNQKLKNAVRDGLISEEEYNILGGYDATQTMGLGPVTTGIGSIVYNIAQSIKDDQPWSDIPGDVARNVKGSLYVPPKLKNKYEEIVKVPMWMGGGLGAGKALLREMLKYFSKGSKHGKSPTEILKMVNPKQFNEMLNRPGGIPALAKEMIEKYTKTIKKERAESIGDIISSAKNIKKADDAVIAHKKWMIEDMVKKGSDRKTAEMFAEGLSKAMAQSGPKGTPKITERGLLELENIHKNLITKGRPLNASGGLARMLGE